MCLVCDLLHLFCVNLKGSRHSITTNSIDFDSILSLRSMKWPQNKKMWFPVCNGVIKRYNIKSLNICILVVNNWFRNPMKYNHLWKWYDDNIFQPLIFFPILPQFYLFVSFVCINEYVYYKNSTDSTHCLLKICNIGSKIHGSKYVVIQSTCSHKSHLKAFVTRQTYQNNNV